MLRLYCMRPVRRTYSNIYIYIYIIYISTNLCCVCIHKYVFDKRSMPNAIPTNDKTGTETAIRADAESTIKRHSEPQRETTKD